MILHQEMKKGDFDREVITRPFSGDWEMQIGKRKDLLKFNPIKDDAEKKAQNFKGVEKSELSQYVVGCADL